MAFDESRFRRLIKDPKQNLQLVRDREHVLSVFKEGASPAYRQRITATRSRRTARIGHRPLHAAKCAYGALVSSLEVLQSMEVPPLRNLIYFVLSRYTLLLSRFTPSVPLVAT